jgi:hypothetical protein
MVVVVVVVWWKYGGGGDSMVVVIVVVVMSIPMVVVVVVVVVIMVIIVAGVMLLTSISTFIPFSSRHRNSSFHSIPIALWCKLLVNVCFRCLCLWFCVVLQEGRSGRWWWCWL